MENFEDFLVLRHGFTIGGGGETTNTQADTVIERRLRLNSASSIECRGWRGGALPGRGR